MTFAPIALADLPAVVKGAKAKSLTDADTATANAVLAILASGNAARSGDAYASKSLAESAGRKMTALLARVQDAPDGTAYRYRTLPAVDGKGQPVMVTVPAVEAVAESTAEDGTTSPATPAVAAHDVAGVTFAIVIGDPAKPRTKKADKSA